MIGVEYLPVIAGTLFTCVCIMILTGIQLFDKWHGLKTLGILAKRLKYLEEKMEELEKHLKKGD